MFSNEASPAPCTGFSSRASCLGALEGLLAAPFPAAPGPPRTLPLLPPDGTDPNTLLSLRRYVAEEAAEEETGAAAR